MYLSDFRACAKLFEMYVADHLTRKFDCRDRPFLLWEDIDHETKEARGLTGADTGVDVTDGVNDDCAVQVEVARCDVGRVRHFLRKRGRV